MRAEVTIPAKQHAQDAKGDRISEAALEELVNGTDSLILSVVAHRWGIPLLVTR
jgi:hypothetical protein